MGPDRTHNNTISFAVRFANDAYLIKEIDMSRNVRSAPVILLGLALGFSLTGCSTLGALSNFSEMDTAMKQGDRGKVCSLAEKGVLRGGDFAADHMYILALCYMNGAPGYPQNNATAVSLLKMAAQQGDTHAQLELAKMGVTVNVSPPQPKPSTVFVPMPLPAPAAPVNAPMNCVTTTVGGGIKHTNCH